MNLCTVHLWSRLDTKGRQINVLTGCRVHDVGFHNGARFFMKRAMI